MKEKTTQNAGFSIKSIYLIILIIGVVTSFNLWIHRNDLPLGHTKYSNFGFSFTYPELYEIHSWGYPDPFSDPTDFGGGVQAKKYWEGTWNNMMVMWKVRTVKPDLDAEIIEFFEEVDSWGCIIDKKYPQFTLEKSGYNVICQTFTFTEESFSSGGDQFIATSGFWYEQYDSIHANRVYIITYIVFLEGNSIQQVQDKFLHHLYSFNSHEDTST